MFYSLVGPEGSTFKINELKIDVYVRNVGKTETTKLECDLVKIKKSRKQRDQVICDADFKDLNIDEYALTRIKGRVNWKATTTQEERKLVKLKLELGKGGCDDTYSEFVLATLEPGAADAPSEGSSEESFDFVCDAYKGTKDENFFSSRGREKGWSNIPSETIPFFPSR